MGLGLLLIPALGGYWLLTHSNRWKFTVLLQSGYHVFFRSAASGLALFSASYVLALVLPGLERLGSVLKIEPDHTEFVLAIVFSALLALAVPPTLNLRFTVLKGAIRAAEARNDLIELTLQRAAQMPMTVEISLRSGKSYVGWVLDSAIFRYGGADADISLLPTTSGHRDPENQQLHFTTDYDKFYDFYDAIGDPGRMRLAIPLSEVLSARLFDMDLYEAARAG